MLRYGPKEVLSNLVPVWVLILCIHYIWREMILCNEFFWEKKNNKKYIKKNHCDNTHIVFCCSKIVIPHSYKKRERNIERKFFKSQVFFGYKLEFHDICILFLSSLFSNFLFTGCCCLFFSLSSLKLRDVSLYSKCCLLHRVWVFS